MKAVVIGSNGQLGTDLVSSFQHRGWDTVGLTHADLAVEDYDSVRRILHSVRPGVVANTAAFHVVPKCEEDPLRAYQVNALGPLNVARACNEVDAASVYFSTDYVFDGAKLAPYVEEDCPHPLNVYGTTKLGGEYFNLAYSRRSLVLRVSGLYGRIPSRAKGTNFVMTMLKAAKERPDVRVVDDERLSPTPTSVIAERTVDLLEAGAEGLYHLVSEGDCSWYEFAKTIFEALQLKTPLIPVHGDAFPSTVRRPSYSVLRNSRLEVSGLPPMPHWRDSLLDFLTPRNH